MSTVIKVENLCKRYYLSHKERGRFPTLRDAISRTASNMGKRLLHPLRASSGLPLDGLDSTEEFWALDDVSFEVKQGDRVGIIGRNGAGKSTLLKVLSRITEPTKGRVSIKGRVASLLEVGTGFHPELTGRENIFLNGAILGMSRVDIRRKFDEIVAFSEVEKFLDTPVKRYSSGMYVRLAFAVAAHLEPEILIIDEVLAVGDVQFQQKCLGKMEEAGNEGRTVLFVSHNLGAIKKLCTSVINLDNGKVVFSGDVEEGVGEYLSSHTKGNREVLSERTDRKGLGRVRLHDCCFVRGDGRKTECIVSGEKITFKIIYCSSIDELDNVRFRFILKNKQNEILFVCNNLHSVCAFSALPGNGEVFIEIAKNPLFEGTYRYDLQIIVNEEVEDDIENAGEICVETGDFFGTGRYPSIKDGLLVDHTWKLG